MFKNLFTIQVQDALKINKTTSVFVLYNGEIKQGTVHKFKISCPLKEDGMCLPEIKYQVTIKTNGAIKNILAYEKDIFLNKKELKEKLNQIINKI